MISKTSIGRVFGAIIRYCIDSKDKNEKKSDRGEVIVSANCYGNKEQLICQFNDQKNSNPKVSRAVWHTSFSFSPDDNEKINDSVLTQIIQDFASEFGFEQYVAIRHTDTEDRFPHFHFIGNRVNLEGKTISDSNNYKRVTAFCRRAEKKFSLSEVMNPKVFQSKEERNLPRKDKRKENLKLILQNILKTCKSFPELKEQLQLNGYRTEIQRGIAFTDVKLVRIKGSQIGYSLDKVRDILQENLSKELNINISKERSRQISIQIN
jgi:hypothetical protein